ncbi:MAG TPA: hypothetical protein VK694_00795 [Verrucomicrobiae bacterium]|nr:hypothetical protein [Verrucomicrobiae bacterium]
MIRDQIDALFDKEMDRKEFLQHVGAGVLIVFGLGGLLKALTTQPQRKQDMGYGASAYGGHKR